MLTNAHRIETEGENTAVYANARFFVAEEERTTAGIVETSSPLPHSRSSDN